jgi:rubredoxin
MKRMICLVCGYVYDPAKGDPEAGIKPGTPWERVPEGWVCPVCGAAKDQFEPE